MAHYKKILLSCTFAIGDVIMATSAAALLKKHDPSCFVAMMIKPLSEEMVRNNPVIDLMISPQYEQKKASFSIMKETFYKIKKEQFDLFISLDGKLRPALLASLARIPKRIGPSEMFGSYSRMPFLLTDHVEVGSYKTTHYTENLRRLIAYATGTEATAWPILPPGTEAMKKKAAGFFESISPLGKKIGLCVKTNPRKTWPAHKFIALIQQLQAQGRYSFFIVGAEYDRAYAEEICQKTGGDVYNLCGKTNLMELATLLQYFDIFVSLDTAPMHMASALNIPQVAIFGCTVPQSVAPLAPNSIVVKPPERDCIPCVPLRVTIAPGITKRTGPKECLDHACMESIAVERVVNEVNSCLQNVNHNGESLN